MNTLPAFAFVILSMLAGIGPKKYEHSYHTGGVSLMNITGHTVHRAKCQLDFTVIKDSLIVGRFQIFDVPSDWKVAPDRTFHGVISKLDSSKKRFFGRVGPDTFEWESLCSFDDLHGSINIYKSVANSKGHNHILGKVENGTRLMFILE